MWHIPLLPNFEVVCLSSICYNVNIAFFFLHLPGIFSHTFILYLSILFHLSSISYKQHKVKFWFKANLTVSMFKRKFYFFHIRCHFWHIWTYYHHLISYFLFYHTSFLPSPNLDWLNSPISVFPSSVIHFCYTIFNCYPEIFKTFKRCISVVSRGNQYWQSPVE